MVFADKLNPLWHLSAFLPPSAPKPRPPCENDDDCDWGRFNWLGDPLIEL
jgi:hypothetical protein